MPYFLFIFFNDRALQTAYTRVFIRVQRGVSQIPYPRIRESANSEAAIGGGASVDRLEVESDIARLKCGKAPGMDGITAEMLKYGDDAVVEWLLLLCERAWKKGEVPDDWTKAIIIPLYKGKGSRSECSSYRGISLLSVPGKVYWRILTDGSNTGESE